MADLNPEVFEDLQVAERSRPLFEAAGLRLRTWEAYALAFNERNLLRREIHRIREGRGSSDIHPEVLERLQALRSELDPMVDKLRRFLVPEPAGAEDRERQEMVLGFIAVSPTARDVASKWIAEPERYRQEATQKLQLIETVVERYRRALRAEIDAQMTSTSPPTAEPVPQGGAVTRIMKRSAETPPAPAAEAAPLGAPATLEAAASNGEVSLIWSAVPGAALYFVKRAATKGGPYTTIARPTHDCYADTDLRNGTTYFYIVLPVDKEGVEGPLSREVEATPLAPPLSPPGLTATPGNSRVSLAWKPSAGAARYKLLRSPTPSGPFTIVVSTSETTFIDTTVANGTAYFYAVAAQNGAGESPASAQAQSMPVAPPPPPVGLAAAAGDGRVTLSWTPVHGASSYTVRRASDPAGPFAIVAGAPVPASIDSGVVNGTTYYYAVSALNAGGESIPGAAVAAMPVGPPDAPEGLRASGGNGEIMLAWNAAAGATSYVVRRAEAAEGPWVAIAQPAGPAYTDTGLANGTPLFYNVTAQNAGGESAACAPLQATPVAPPAAPPKLTATAGNTRVILTWAPSLGATSYVLKRGSAPGGPHETIATPQANSHADLLLANDTTYYYILAAKNAGGESAPSAEAAATPLGPPGAPTEVEAAPGNASIALRWRPVANTERYRVMRSTTPGGPYTAIANPAESSYLDSGVANGTTYCYVVRAMNEGGKGAYSPEVRATPVATPSAPAGLVATPANGSVALTWAAVADATSYAVHRASSADGPFLPVATPATTSAIDAQVTNGTTYFYAVTARNAGGESALSAALSVVPLAPPPAPSGLAATPGNGRVSLVWTAPPRAAAYTVRRATAADGPFEPAGTTLATEFNDTTVTNGTIYHYVVSAQNDGGESAPSAVVTAAPVAPPPAPTGLQLSAGDGSVALSWSPAPRATSYSIRRAVLQGGPYAVIAAPAIPSHIDADTLNGTTYHYAILALNAGGESAPSAEASVTPTAAPAAVAALEATAGNGLVSLHWPAVENASSYAVKRSLEAEGSFAPIATVPSCDFVDSGLTNGTPYHYRVNALNAGGGGPDSGTASATPVAPPPAPSGLSTSSGNREVELKWASSARASSYLVKRAETPGGPYSEIATAVGPGHQDTGLENEKTYYYVVTAVNAGGESAPSAEAQGVPVEAPAIPANVTATAGNKQVLIAWTAAPGATYYRVKRATDRRGPYVTVANVSRVSHVDNGVENGMAYYYVVHALNAGGRSGYSPRVSATPVPPPPPPTSVIALAGNFRVSLTWDAVPGATGYSIKRSISPNGPFSTIARIPQTSYFDAAVTNGTTYYYMVRSATGVIKGPLSPQVRATPTAPPSAPGGLSAAPGHGMIALSWNVAPGATCYHVKRAGTADGKFETIASPDEPGWEDIGLANGGTYHYRVSAENAGGESPDSLAVVASPVAPPAVPTGLQALPASGEVTLAWNAVPGAVQYRVKRSASREGPFTPIAQPAGAGYTDTGLVNGTPCHYVVSALNAHGESFDSFPAQATPVGVPGTPVGLTALPGNAKIDLSWAPVPLAMRYRVMRSGAPGGPYVLVASPRDAAYSDCPLTNGIPQHYVVSAVNAGGESPASAEASAAPTPSAPLPSAEASSPRAPKDKPAKSGLPAEASANSGPNPAPGRTVEDVPTLESISMPSGKKAQGIDLERLLDLRRVEQLRVLFEETAQKFEEWEVLILIAEEGYETRRTMELLLRLKNQGKGEDFTSGAVALFEKVLKIRAQYTGFVRKLRPFLENLDVKAQSREVLEIALGFILQAPRGRGRAEKWVEEPEVHRKGAGEYMRMAYTIAQKYQAAL
jgi:fibronectin type 3 domain-containing protein